MRGYASVALQKCHLRHIFEQERVIIRLRFLKILVTGVGKRLGRDGVPRSDVVRSRAGPGERARGPGSGQGQWDQGRRDRCCPGQKHSRRENCYFCEVKAGVTSQSMTIRLSSPGLWATS